MKKAKRENYDCYVLLDYDVIKNKYILEIYDFRDYYLNVKTFDTFSDMVDYFHNELPIVLQVKQQNVLQICSNTYQRKLGLNDYKKLDEETIFKKGKQL